MDFAPRCRSVWRVAGNSLPRLLQAGGSRWVRAVVGWLNQDTHSSVANFRPLLGLPRHLANRQNAEKCKDLVPFPFQSSDWVRTRYIQPRKSRHDNPEDFMISCSVCTGSSSFSSLSWYRWLTAGPQVSFHATPAQTSPSLHSARAHCLSTAVGAGRGKGRKALAQGNASMPTAVTFA
jgi:hypothetical protein